MLVGFTVIHVKVSSVQAGPLQAMNMQTLAALCISPRVNGDISCRRGTRVGTSSPDDADMVD
jgi:hypothetical protein